MIKSILVSASLLVAVSLRAEIEFVGVMISSYTTRVALTDKTNGRTEWLSRGDSFAGYKVTAYDNATETVVLQRGQDELRIRIKDDGKVKSASLELTGAISLGGDRKLEIERATLLFDHENVFPLQDGVTYRITPTRQADGNVLYRMLIERVLGPNKTERLSSPSFVTLPGKAFSFQIGEFGFSFKPRP
jgi:hypothetical protein